MFIHFLMKTPIIIRNFIHQTEEIWQLIACFNHLNPWSSMKIPLESWFIMVIILKVDKSICPEAFTHAHFIPVWCSNNFKPSVFHSFLYPRILYRIHVEASVFPCFPMVFPTKSREEPRLPAAVLSCSAVDSAISRASEALTSPRSARAAPQGGHRKFSMGWKTPRVPSGKHTKSYWKWPFIVDFPIENGDFP